MREKSFNVLMAITFILVIIGSVIVIKNSVLAITYKNNIDYSSIDLNKLDEIKSNTEALNKVREVSAVSYEYADGIKILEKLELIKLCPNLERIYICVNGLSLDKTFFNNLSSKKEVSVSIQWGSVDFAGVDNSNITELYLSENKVYNFSNLSNLKSLKILSTDAVDGFYDIDFGRLTRLESLMLKGQKIEDYEKFFSRIKNIKVLGLDCCNLQNSDTNYMKKMTNLQELNLNGTFVSDISFLKELPNLKGVTLPLGVSNLGVLYSMPYLNWISFDGFTETNIDNELVRFFNTNNIIYPEFDTSIKTKIQTIVKSFGFTENTTEREKIEKVTEYVLKNMKSDANMLNNINMSDQEGKATTLDLCVNYGYGVCHYYSTLEYTLLKLVGVEVYYVEGYALFSEKGAPGSHAWNMVRVDGSWYGIDSLWLDDDNNDPTTSDYKKSVWILYYMKNTKTDNLHEWPSNTSSQEYIDKNFALCHRTFNNPQDTVTDKINIVNIAVTVPPTKTTYIQNYEKLDLTGGILTIEYSDKTVDKISLDDKNVKITGFDNTKIGTNSVKVEYKNKVCAFDVKITSKDITKIDIDTLPIKTIYAQNEELDLTGGILKVTYSDGTTDTISMNNENIKVVGFDSSVLGTNTLSITYGEKVTTFDIQIVESVEQVPNSSGNTISINKMLLIILGCIVVSAAVMVPIYIKSKKV